MLMSMCSPSSSGSTAGGSMGTDTGRPSSPSSGFRLTRYSTVLVAICPILQASVPLALRPQRRGLPVREPAYDTQLLGRVVRLQIDDQRTPRLLRAAETAAQRKVLPQRVTLRVVLGHQDPAQVRVAVEADPEHVVRLALEPVRTRPQRHDRVDLQRVQRELHLHAKRTTVRDRPELVDDLQRTTAAEIDRRHVQEQV